MRRIFPVFVLCAGLFACADDGVSRFRGSQISRLLTSGSEAGWLPGEITFEGQSILSSCSDSTGYFFEALEDEDSILVSQLVPFCNGTGEYDTLEIGKAMPSVQDEIFSDSLVFATGSFWLIQEIFSEQVKFQDSDVIYALLKGS